MVAPVSSRTIARSLAPPRLLHPIPMATKATKADALVSKTRAEFRPSLSSIRRLDPITAVATRELSDDVEAFSSDMSGVKDEDLSIDQEKLQVSFILLFI